jgi:hypothetical protein
VRLNERSDVAFNVSVDFALDRLCEVGCPDPDKYALLDVIRYNITNPHLMKITLENTEMIEADNNKYTQKYILMETLQNVFDIIMPYGNDDDLE